MLSTVTPGHDFGNEIEIVAGFKADDQVLSTLQTPSSPGRKSKLFRQRCRETSSGRSPKMILFENPRQVPWLAVLLAIAVLQLSGCEVGPKYHPPLVQSPPAYKEVGNWKPAQPNDQNLGGTWWTMFQDPQLDALELQV
jgi:hypothetical protein